MPRDAELLLWNDASTDGTVDVVSRIDDNRVRIITSDESVGSGVARSRMLADSDSEYVACMDADDVCLPWRFSRSSMRCHDVTFGTIVRFAEKPFRARLSLPFRYSPAQSSLALLIHNPFAQSTMLAKRSVLDSVGGWSGMRMAQDYELWLRLAGSGASITKHARPVVMYRESPTQITRRDDYTSSLRSSGVLMQAYRSLLEQELGRNGKDAGAARRALGASVARWRPGPRRTYYERLLERQGSFLLNASLSEPD
jgi:hypothetical protein